MRIAEAYASAIFLWRCAESNRGVRYSYYKNVITCFITNILNKMKDICEGFCCHDHQEMIPSRRRLKQPYDSCYRTLLFCQI